MSIWQAHKFTVWYQRSESHWYTFLSQPKLHVHQVELASWARVRELVALYFADDYREGFERLG